MTPPAALPRKRTSGPRAGKGESADTIRVAKVIAPVVPPPSRIAPREPEEDLAAGLPCSGRCGHCHHHPCRLHGGV